MATVESSESERISCIPARKLFLLEINPRGLSLGTGVLAVVNCCGRQGICENEVCMEDLSSSKVTSSGSLGRSQLGREQVKRDVHSYPESGERNATTLADREHGGLKDWQLRAGVEWHDDLSFGSRRSGRVNPLLHSSCRGLREWDSLAATPSIPRCHSAQW